ncbi:MAG: energy transducer TonB [bacterium]|jgi:protein TonB|nr:energy transducer TonB [Candidatus Neomarinimicrobiota bacterium]MDD3966232.1 energy transducer TonB [Candidatus Neomarinimicrobiota bacterium]MDX9779892.1 energy transducer TonB [bacterium]
MPAKKFEYFKARSGFVTEIALVAALALVVLTVYLFPKFEREAALERETVIEFIQSEEVPQVELQQIQAPQQRPSIPVMSEDEDISEDFTIDDMDFDDYTALDAPPPPPSGDDGSGGIVVEFIAYDEPPTPVGGQAAIARNTIYPEIAKEAGIEGQVVVQAFINEKGVVEHCLILKGMPGTGLDESAINAIKMTRFKPAKQRDRDVGVWISIPVTFKLNTK